MKIDPSFLSDPIISPALYPELLLDLPQMPIIYLKNKHFFKKDLEMLKSLDGELYLFICPTMNWSIANITVDRDGEKYPFSPYAYAKTKEHEEKYLKFGFQVFDCIQELKKAVYFEGCEEVNSNIQFTK
jgi:hypothetical protein